MALAKDKFSEKAMGGTELLKFEMVRRINEMDPNLLDHFQIFVSRVHEPINKDKIVIYWLHDLADDPAAAEELKNGRWKRFDLLVFVSNWQMQQYIMLHRIPFSKCIVLENCIVPFEPKSKDYNGKINLIYTSTPHRGLQILVPVFEALQKEFPDKLHLDVFSSFELYGWKERDAQFAELFERCKSNEDITYYGAASNEAVRSCLETSHIFAYPSIWPETSCLCLIESMSAGLICVHPNFGALPDTSGGLTSQYQWHEDINAHADRFYSMMRNAILFTADPANEGSIKTAAAFQKLYADSRFSWEQRQHQWFGLLQSLVIGKESLIKTRQPDPSEAFSFRTS